MININFKRKDNYVILEPESRKHIDMIRNILTVEKKVPTKTWDRSRGRLVHNGYRMEPVDMMQYSAYQYGFPYGWLNFVNNKLTALYPGEYKVNVDISEYYDNNKTKIKEHVQDILEKIYPIEKDEELNEEAKEFYEGLGFRERFPRYYQHNALYEALTKKQCLVKSPTATGKTFIAYMIAKSINRPTIMITNTKGLSAQNADDFKEYGWPEDRIFMYNSEIKKLPDRLMIENHEPYILFIVDKSLPKIDFLDKIDTMIVDECLDSDTNILTEKGYVKLKNIEIGDEVITPGGHAIVKDKWVTKKTAYEYTLSDGTTIIGSKDHLFLSTESMDYIVEKASNIKKMVKFTGEYGRLEYNKDEYFLGLFLGDGTCDRSTIKFGFRKDIEFFTHIFKDIYPNVKIRKNKRGDTVFTLPHVDAINFVNRWDVVLGNKTNTVEIPKELFDNNSVGVIKGLFDAEGYRTKGRIGLDMTSKTMVYQISSILNHYGIDNTVKCIESDVNNPNRNPRYRLSIYGNNINTFNRLIGFRIDRKNISNISKYAIKQMSDTLDIVSVKRIDERELIDIELDDDDKLFIANGIVTHNCHHSRADTYMTNLPNIGAYIRIGLSATPLDHKNPNDKLRTMSYIGPLGYEYTISDAYKDGYVTSIEYHVHEINKVVNYNDYEYKEIQLMALSEFDEIREVCITKNKYFNDKIKEYIVDQYPESKIVILVDLIEQGEKLKEIIPDSVFVSGQDDISTREQFRKGMEDGKVKRIISTKIFTEGVNITSLEHIVLAGPKKGVIPVVQAIGRTMRKSNSKNKAIVHDFCHNTHGMLTAQLNKRIKIYQEKTHGEVKFIGG